MSNFVDPHSGSARLYEDHDLFQIHLKSKSSVFVTVFIGFWLCGWAFGEFTVLGQLFSGQGFGGGVWFLIFWLCAWTVGGIIAISQFLWGVAGYELLTLSEGELTIERCIPIFKRRWNYDVNEVKNFRAGSAVPTGLSFSGRQSLNGMFSNRGEGTLKFDYGFLSPGFGIGLEEAEAKWLAEKLEVRLAK